MTAASTKSGKMPTGSNPGKAAERAQSRASKPGDSSWVSASAGTGKTYVLTQRVLRLLLNGASPERILCLTFTKAAAAEMTNRVAESLGRWALADNKSLRRDLAKLTGRPPDKTEIIRARTLFATCLDVPGGMRIQTIHAFCQALLKRFPLEADIPPHFQVIEEGDQRALLDDVRNSILANDATGQGRFAAELAVLSTIGGPDDLTGLLGEFLRKRGRLRDALKDARSVDAAVSRLRQEAGVAEGLTPDAVITGLCAEGAFDRDGLLSCARALLEGNKSDIPKGEKIAAWLAADAGERSNTVEDYARAFLTGTGTPYKNMATKAVVAAEPNAPNVMSAEATRLLSGFDQLATLRIVERSAAVFRLGAAVHQGYEREKARRAVLDFDDLILRSEDLLTRRAAADWVLFKLDGGIDHILVDEAQDTSPDQWRLVDAIAREFFSGSGIERRPADDGLPAPPRTIFAVGDHKQSIYSFQGADPVVFETVRSAFGKQVQAGNETWSPVDLDVSFRSVQPVLDAVDSTFAEGKARDGVVEPEATLTHTAWRQGQGGLVELWPILAPADKAEPKAWTTPEIETDTASPTVELARRIAAQARDWIDGKAGGVWDKTVDPIAPRRPRAGDIMILVRRRTELVEELIRSLKASNIDVAGTDRMALIEQLAVMDLLAVADFLLLPDDDLTLATVLKGPLFGFDDDQLFALAHNRGETVPLWRRLREAADPAAQAARRTLLRYLNLVDTTPPYELLKSILTTSPTTGMDGETDVSAPSGREKFWSRLGPDALEPLEELLNLALLYQHDNPPSLQEFLHWLRRRDAEIKRDMESVPDAVRIMTVHGSKGLQAPIVILPDTNRLPRTADKLLWPNDGLPVVNPANDEADARSSNLKTAAADAQQQEYNRLLYVAMTRAEDALIVCGHKGANAIDENCWHDLVRAGLQRLPASESEERPGFEEPVLRFGSLPPLSDVAMERTEPETADEVETFGDIELDALLQPPPIEHRPPSPLTPSRPDGEEPPVFSPFDATPDRFRRGAIIHHLLQHLPDHPPDARAGVGAAYLARASHGLGKADQEQILEETLTVMNLPEAAALFGPGSMAEAPITGVVGDAVISGQIDRLAIAENAIAIVDYKTNRPPPSDPAQVPSVYLRQMAAYRALLQRLYPGRAVQCFLLWTAIPHLMLLDEQNLEAVQVA